VGGLSHYFENEGIPTTSISLIRQHTERLRPPRALAVPFELGRPFGVPDEPEFQRRVLGACLGLFERTSGPVLEDFPDKPPGSDEDTAGWTCPVSFAPPPEDLGDAEIVCRALVQEIGLLKPWYEEAVRSQKRSGFGISGKTPEEIADFLAEFVTDPDATEPPYPGEAIGTGFKRMADDLRYYYIQAAIARPDARSTDVEVANWLWGETTLGQVLIAIRDHAMDCEETSLKRLATTAMVPTHQRFRTKHG
jgi:hypothetical protein